MGTSSSFGGGNNSNPLIPSWLGAGGNGGATHHDNDGGQGNDNEGNENNSQSDQSLNQSISTKKANRHSAARGNFTTYLKSGGADRRSLGKSLSSYVGKTAGGSRKATQRMLSDTLAGIAFAQFLTSANSIGIREAVRKFDLPDLSNKSSVEIYAALIDVVCEPGGDLDDSFARAAYSDAIVEVFELGLPDLEKPSLETISIIMERFIANSIFNRILNAIGNKTILLPDNVQTVNDIVTQLKDFIRGAVSDAIARSGDNFATDDMRTHINKLYEQSFSILQSLAEQEAEE